MKIIALLRDHAHTAWLAGGCVRDELLGLTPTDFDIATSATPTQIRAIFPSAHSVGEHFGVMLVKLDAEIIEIATFRTDGHYADARRPDSVTFADDTADAQRRDFTINAIFLDPAETPGPDGVRGRVIDYVGGLSDLRAKVIRAVGDPDERLREDHLRALRAVRFAARLGFTIDAGTASAITRHASDLRGVSRERIGDELRRMLSAPTRAAAVRLLQQLGLDEPILTEAANPRSLRLLSNLRPLTWTRQDFLAGAWSLEAELSHARPNGPVPVAAALAAWALDRHGNTVASTDSFARVVPGSAAVVGLTAEQVTAICRGWRASLMLSNDESETLRDILLEYTELITNWTTLPVSGRKRLAAKPGFGFALELARCHDRVLFDSFISTIDVFARDITGIAPSPFVTGDHLVAVGMRPGKPFKRLLDLVYDAQLEGRVRTFEQAMELSRTLGV
ncbi:MAG: CCA tRNA nucleotidyltransferase [Phycisphaerales bacterium]|nr:CCA tRNA nucleotidyltransferase [Phycisphaerales bacterium]